MTRVQMVFVVRFHFRLGTKSVGVITLKATPLPLPTDYVWITPFSICTWVHLKLSDSQILILTCVFSVSLSRWVGDGRMSPYWSVRLSWSRLAQHYLPSPNHSLEQPTYCLFPPNIVHAYFKAKQNLLYLFQKSFGLKANNESSQ